MVVAVAVVVVKDRVAYKLESATGRHKLSMGGQEWAYDTESFAHQQ